MTALTKIHRRIGALFHSTLVMSALLLVPAMGQVAVSNVRAAQRPGTNLVDIDYDVTGTTKPVKVTMLASDDDGTTFSVPATSLSGAVGGGITPGPNLRITWDAGTDWAGHFSTLGRFAITADDAEFVLIPAGSFEMGDSLGDGTSDELPVHTVQVSAFHMAKYEVTKALWDDVRTWGLIHGYTDLSVGAGKAATHPVQTITWYDMVKWCNARSEKEGLTPCYYTDAAQTAVFKTGPNNIDNTMVKWTANGYRLPTEAEWEKAERGGLSGKRFPWGDAISHGQANFWNYGGESYQSGSTGPHPIWSNNDDGNYPYTSPVGTFTANGYGLHDMAGNLWEWCWDWYGSYSAGLQTDPHGGVSGPNRVYRGGGWDYNAYYCRVAYRYSYDPGYSGSNFGFRIARNSVP
jgi:formylglycine-generating enzyme required for sulfatase activity